MKEFIKENWFKMVISVSVIMFTFLYGISVYTQYQTFISDQKCLNSDNFLKMKEDKDSVGIINCVLKYPSHTEFYEDILRSRIWNNMFQ